MNNKVDELSGAVASKLDINSFNSYSGNLNTNLSNQFNNINQTIDGLQNNKLNKSVFSTYSAATKTVIDSKLDSSAFTSYSASVTTEIEDNELATSEAINDINSRIINIVGEIDDNELATSEAINDLNSRVINIVDNTYTKTEVDDAISNIDISSQLSNYISLSDFMAYSAATETRIAALEAEINSISSGITAGDY